MGTAAGKVRHCESRDFEAMYEIVNEAAKAFKSVLPANAYREPQMLMDELFAEFERVTFFGYEEDGKLLGVMGYEFVQDLALIRHAYVSPGAQGRGIGALLLKHVERIIATSGRTKRIIIGTYTKASWAISFYERHGYRRSVDPQTLLIRYYNVPAIQRQNSLTLEKELN